MTSTRPKKHHFVPQLHLRYFTGIDPKGMVWTYDAGSDRVSPSLPKETAAETNFYSTVDDGGNHLDDIEEWLAKVESAAAPVYEKLIRGEIPLEQERADFSTFLASMYTRTHSMRRIFAEMQGGGASLIMQALLSSKERLDEHLARANADGVDVPAVASEEMYEWMKNPDNYVINIHQDATLKAIELSDKLQEIFFEMGWAVVNSGQHYLITSDTPVAKVVPPSACHPLYGDGGFLNKEVRITFPLSPNKCLVLFWGKDLDDRIPVLDRETVRTFNRQRAFFSEKYVFADRRDDGIRKLVQKHKDNGLKITSSASGPDVKMVRRFKEEPNLE